MARPRLPESSIALIRGRSKYSRPGQDRRPRPEACRPPSDAGTDVFGGVQSGVATVTCKKRRVIWGMHLSERTPSSRPGSCRLGHPRGSGIPDGRRGRGRPDQARRRAHDPPGCRGPSNPTRSGSRSNRSRRSPGESTRLAPSGVRMSISHVAPSPPPSTSQQ